VIKETWGNLKPGTVSPVSCPRFRMPNRRVRSDGALQMFRYPKMSHVLLIILFCCDQRLAARVDLHRPVEGSWLIVGRYSTRNISAVSDEDMRALIGKRISISSDALESCGQRVKVKSVTTRFVKKPELILEERVSFEELGVKSDSLEEVETVFNQDQSVGCLGHLSLPGDHIYLKSANWIIVEFEGAFLSAKKIPTKEAVQLTFGPVGEQGPAVSPDGRLLANSARPEL